MKKLITCLLAGALLFGIVVCLGACTDAGAQIPVDTPSYEYPDSETDHIGFEGESDSEPESESSDDSESESESESETASPTEMFVVFFKVDGELWGDFQKVYEGNLVSVPEAPVKEDYTFVGWYVEDELWNFETDVVTGDMELVAKFEETRYTVTFNSDGGTSVASQLLKKGELITYPTPPTKEGCVFVGWFYNGVQWNFESGTVTGDITLVARWNWATSGDTFTVTFYTGEGSAVAPQQVQNGSVAIEPQDPTREGYTFEGWYTLDNVRWNFSRPITETMTLVAKWKEKPVDIEDIPPEVPAAPTVAISTGKTSIATSLITPPTPTTTTVGEGVYYGFSKDAAGQTILLYQRVHSAFLSMAQKFNMETKGTAVIADTGDKLLLDEDTAEGRLHLRVSVLAENGSLGFGYVESSIRTSSDRPRVVNAALWLERHSATYGFVKDGTSYRYVGAGIALALRVAREETGTNVSVTDMLDDLMQYTEEGDHCIVNLNDGTKYEIWYAEPDAQGRLNLPTVKGYDYVPHGDGYIVSVKIH